MQLSKLKKAGEIHKNVETFARDFLEENKNTPILLYDIAEKIEQKIEELCANLGEKCAGIAFPTGVNLNNCAAHFTPNPNKGDRELTLNTDDIIKIDYGVHIDGHIIDGAFSYTQNVDNKFESLIEASKESVWSAIKMAGPDQLLCEIGANTQEIIESYEIDIDGETKSLRSIGDLCGHQIGQYLIHSGKVVPNIKWNGYKARMNEGELFAIETFPSSGSGKVKERPSECSHYMMNYSNPKYQELGGNIPFFNTTLTYFNTLAFCKRWIIDKKDINFTFDNINYKNTNEKLKKLCKIGAVSAYPPLYDEKGSYISQTEKTIYISSSGNIVLN